MNARSHDGDRSPARAEGRPRVVIVGGGFGGLSAAKALSGGAVEVMIVDRLNHHLFQPMLYQVATGIVSEGEIAPPLRGIFRDRTEVQTRLAEVTGFDLQSRRVEAAAADGERLTIHYDFLLLAAGATHNYFGNDEWAQYAPGLKTLRDAHRLRSRILGAFEMAADAASAEERAAWLTFVTVGGGPTGVELTGQIAELSHRLLRHEFKVIDTARAKIVLLDAGPSVLAAFPKRLQARARRDLEAMGVEVRPSTRVTGVDEHGVEAQDQGGESIRLDARTVIWAAGVKASPLARLVGEATGAEVDRAGRVSVNPDCTLPGHPEVFAIGDMISLDHLPGVAQPAIQQGRFVARAITQRLSSEPATERFRYFNKGSMATIGHGRAVASAFGVNIGGLSAAVLWAGVHLMYLVGWGNRLGTVARWVWGMVARDRRELCIVDNDSIAPWPHDRDRQHGERDAREMEVTR